ncbi:MAG TPA: TetR/AcrR family transcriptional regulator [Candidatus Acidoferrales bacterium]|nr:TetR/AcrR family transcriptional regulator [Candidatus Acidoferrales bacterium]
MTRKASLENIAKRKEQIVRAAISAIARTGLKETSMDDIVRESGLSKGAIYWYYKSKDEIISELIEEFFNPEEINRMEKLLARGTAVERMDRFIEYMIEEMKKMQRFRPVIQELFVIASRDQKIKKMMRRDFRAGVILLQNIIEDGIHKREFRRVDPSIVTITIYQIIEGAALFWTLGIEMDFEKQVRGGIKLIMDGIKTHK